MGLYEWKHRLCTWAEEDEADDRGLGCKLLNGRSGPRWKADDTIARDAVWWIGHSEAAVQIVSEDKQVRKRCREAVRLFEANGADGIAARSVQGRLRFESSQTFSYALQPQHASPPPHNSSKQLKHLEEKAA